jgi:tetratricopeptide (TPR) repeat protein
MNALHAIAIVLQNQGRLDEAEPLMRKVVEVRLRAWGPMHGDTAHATHLLARLLRSQGRPADAEPMYRQALKTYRRLFGPKSPQYTLDAMLELALSLMDQGKLDEAESLAREALPALRGISPGYHAKGLVALGAIQTAAGKHAEAEPHLREGLNIRRGILPRGHWVVADGECALGGCLTGLKRFAKAEPLLLSGLDGLQKDVRASPQAVRKTHDDLIELYEAWGKPDQAKEWRDKGVVLLDRRVLKEQWAAKLHQEVQKLYRLFRETCPEDAGRRNQIAWILATAFDPALRDPPEAVELARKAVEADPRKAAYWNTLGVAQYRVGEWKAGIAALERSRQFGEGGTSFDFFFLAMAHRQAGAKEQARHWYEQAVQWMVKNRPQDEQLREFRAEASALLGIQDQLPGRER